jgi:hypothetical protein
MVAPSLPTMRPPRRRGRPLVGVCRRHPTRHRSREAVERCNHARLDPTVRRERSVQAEDDVRHRAPVFAGQLDRGQDASLLSRGADSPPESRGRHNRNLAANAVRRLGRSTWFDVAQAVRDGAVDGLSQILIGKLERLPHCVRQLAGSMDVAPPGPHPDGLRSTRRYGKARTPGVCEMA